MILARPEFWPYSASFKRFDGFAKAILDRAGGDAERLGGFGDGKALIVMEVDGLSGVLVQLFDERVELASFLAFRGGFGRTRRVIRATQPPFVRRLFSALILPPPIDIDVVADAVQPG